MKKIILIPVLLFICISCTNETETVRVEHRPDTLDTITIGCLGSFETLESGETINQVYGKEHIKHGHWINFGMVLQEEDQPGKIKKDVAGKVARVKMEEGHYRYNKKEGFWKFYNEDGGLRDSVEYKNDVPLKKES